MQEYKGRIKTFDNCTINLSRIKQVFPIKAENVACKSRNFSKLLCLKYSPNSIRTFPCGERSIYLFPPFPPPSVRLTAPLPVNRVVAARHDAARCGAAKRLVAWPQTISPGGVNSAPVCCHFICYVRGVPASPACPSHLCVPHVFMCVRGELATSCSGCERRRQPIRRVVGACSLSDTCLVPETPRPPHTALRPSVDCLFLEVNPRNGIK